jgi:hypothetical protein
MNSHIIYEKPWHDLHMKTYVSVKMSFGRKWRDTWSRPNTNVKPNSYTPQTRYTQWFYQENVYAWYGQKIMGMYQGRALRRATTPKGQELSNQLNRETCGHHNAIDEECPLLL